MAICVLIIIALSAALYCIIVQSSKTLNEQKLSFEKRLEDQIKLDDEILSGALEQHKRELEKCKTTADQAIRKAQKDAEDMIQNIRLEADQLVRAERQQTLFRQAELATKSDRELLINQTGILERYFSKVENLEFLTDLLTTEIKKQRTSAVDLVEPKKMRNDKTVPIGAFRYIVAKVMEKERKTSYYIRDMAINCRTISLSGNSEWNFSIDFNNRGKVTGNYRIETENYDSEKPQEIAKAVQSELQRYIEIA